MVIGQLVVLFGPTLWLVMALLMLAIVGHVTALVFGTHHEEAGLQAWHAVLDAVHRAWDRVDRRDDRNPP